MPRFEDFGLAEGNELRNKASDFVAARNSDVFERSDFDALKRASAPGSVFEDRRALIALPDLESAFSFQEMEKNVGCESTVLATRGDRVAVVHQRVIAPTHDFGSEYLQVTAINLDGKGLCSILFDLTDLDAALAEADRRFLEDEGRGCRMIHELSTRMMTDRDATPDSSILDHLLTHDFRLLDHRPLGSGVLERSAYLSYMGAAAEHAGERAQRVRRILAFAHHVRLAEVFLTVGGSAEWHMLVLHARDGEQVCITEIWDPADAEVAIGRFHELTDPEGAAPSPSL